MQFVKIKELADGVEPLCNRLVRDLADGKQVLWLVPGGSNIPLSVAVMGQLPDEQTAHLTIMLTDERFGTVGHKDSNARQLYDAGFEPARAKVIPVLREGLSLKKTCLQYAKDFQEAVQAADVVIAQLGMGKDGHIAGILPESPAVSSGDLAAGYKAPGFTRITLTPKALHQINVAFLFAFGQDKRTALQRLQSETLPVNEQPAQLLKQIPEAYIYNDQIGQNGEIS